MNFHIIFLLSLSAFFSGGAFSSLFCIIFAKVFKKKHLKARFSIIFVFLSIAIVAFTLIFFVDREFFSLFPLGLSDLLFFVTVFVAGLMVTAFWKVMLPIFIVCYIGFTVYFGVSLYKSFGIPSDEQRIMVSKTDEAVEAEIFVLNEKLLLPLPRVWFKIKIVGTESDLEFEKLTEKIIEKHFLESIPLPKFSVAPAVFNVRCERTLETVNFSVKKAL